MIDNPFFSQNQNDSSSKTKDTRSKIIKAAIKIFSEQGYARATTRIIAAEAGINEVTLFRHFGSKENLFKTLVEQFGGPKVAHDLDTQLTGNYHEDIHMMAQYYMKILCERGDYVKLILCESDHFPELNSIMANNPKILRESLAKYLGKQIKNRVLRPLNPEIAAQAFIGMFFSFAVTQNVFNQNINTDSKPQEIASTFADIFIEGTISS